MNLDDLRKKAKMGSGVAQTLLGICYLDGIETEVNYREAFALLSEAAASGIPRAQFNLGRIYAGGIGVTKDVGEAIRLYEAAAEAGEFLAQVELGRLFSSGVLVTADREAARKWYSAALAQEQRILDCPEIKEARLFLESGPATGKGRST